MLAQKEQMDLNDKQLLLKCRHGDESAWETLIQRYQRLVYSVPRRAGLNRDDCAEVFQEVFTALIQSADEIEQPERLNAWLVTTARRKTWRQISKAREHHGNISEIEKEDRRSEAIIRDAGPLPDELLVRLEQQHQIWTAINTLDDRCRKLLVALFYNPEPPSYAELARSLTMSEGSIGPTRARCLEKLTQLIEK